MNITDEDWSANKSDTTKIKPLNLDKLSMIETLFKENGFIPKEYCQQVIDEARKSLTTKVKK